MSNRTYKGTGRRQSSSWGRPKKSRKRQATKASRQAGKVRV